jgi:hypothetical protein
MLVLAAVMLPAWHAWGIALWMGALYTLSFFMDTWRQILRETGFEVREGRHNPGEDEYTVLTSVRTE